MTTFISGMTAALSLVAALFFLRFWRRTADRFFLLFCLSFVLFALGRFAVLLVQSDEQSALVYLPRLLGFVLIIAAIVDKNRSA